jgi:hypothetical protein
MNHGWHERAAPIGDADIGRLAEQEAHHSA